MKFTRREFIRGGVAAFTVSFARAGVPLGSGARAGRVAAATSSCCISPAATTR